MNKKAIFIKHFQCRVKILLIFYQMLSQCLGSVYLTNTKQHSLLRLNKPLVFVLTFLAEYKSHNLSFFKYKGVALQCVRFFVY